MRHLVMGLIRVPGACRETAMIRVYPIDIVDYNASIFDPRRRSGTEIRCCMLALVSDLNGLGAHTDGVFLEVCAPEHQAYPTKLTCHDKNSR